MNVNIPGKTTINVECPECGPQTLIVTDLTPTTTEGGLDTYTVHFTTTPLTCEHIRAATEEDQ